MAFRTIPQTGLPVGVLARTVISTNLVQSCGACVFLQMVGVCFLIRCESLPTQPFPNSPGESWTLCKWDSKNLHGSSTHLAWNHHWNETCQLPAKTKQPHQTQRKQSSSQVFRFLLNVGLLFLLVNVWCVLDRFDGMSCHGLNAQSFPFLLWSLQFCQTFGVFLQTLSNHVQPCLHHEPSRTWCRFLKHFHVN